MGKKKKTLPKNFGELVEAGDLAVLKAVFDSCEWDARGGYSKETALSFFKIPDELVRWLVEQGADIKAANTYSRTALHEQAEYWCGNVGLLIELGADIDALDYQNHTPLHMAAGRYRTEAVKTLLAHGANILAQNKMGHTPLAHALARCQNADIEPMAEIADILLAAGTPVTPDMAESVARIGKSFEFHRENFNKDSLAATDAALSRLYQVFGVAPEAKRQMHDGVSPIIPTASGWQAQHHELWNLLIPSQGSASTVQGEVIRITGKVSREILGNGGCNWDKDFKKMLDALLRHLASGTPLDAASLQEAATLVKRIYNGDGDDETDRLCDLAVQWVRRNPGPVGLGKPDYRR